MLMQPLLQLNGVKQGDYRPLLIAVLAKKWGVLFPPARGECCEVPSLGAPQMLQERDQGPEKDLSLHSHCHPAPRHALVREAGSRASLAVDRIASARLYPALRS